MSQVKEVNTINQNMTNEPKHKKTMSYEGQKKVWAAIFLAPWLIGFIGLFMIPMIASFRYSFYHLVPGAGGGIEETFVGIKNYYDALQVHALGNTIFKVEMINTMTDVLINLPVIIIFSLFIATILNAEFKGRAIVRAIFFIPVILNSGAVISAMGSGEAMSDILAGDGSFGVIFELDQYLLRAGIGEGLVTFVVGLIDRIYSILALSGVPILLFLASIQSIPRHLYEAAEIEGATKYEMFWLITLPNITPHLVTVAVFVLIDTFLTSPVSNYIAKVLSSNQWGLSSAMSWIYVSVAVLILVMIGTIAKVFKWGDSHYD